MKKFNLLATALLLSGILLSKTAFTQTTGSIDTSISFMGGSRTISLYIPPSYDTAIAYRLMICLHGLGDNSVNYRNTLISALSWNSYIGNTIFVCPEGSSVNVDYYTPAGDETIIQSSIDLAKQHYHIDTNNIILQGFSLGGRAALRYGLDNYSKFKGLLLNTPAAQGVKEAINGIGSYNFNYSNSPNIPVYITHGGDDIMYENPIDSMFEQLVLHNGIVRKYEFAGMGHTIPPTASIIDFIPYFNTPAPAPNDLDLVKVSIPERSCTHTLPATCLVRNTGNTTINSFVLNYIVGGTSHSYTWTGILDPFQHAVITLPAFTIPDGNQSLDVTVGLLNGSIADTITNNNEKIDSFKIISTGAALPVFEGFEGVFPPTNWIQRVAGDFYSPMYKDNVHKKAGHASMAAFNTAMYFENSGRKEELASPVLNLASVPNPALTFEVAYNYHHYTPPTTIMDTTLSDTLEVLISTDGGNTNTTLYKKSGADLATFAHPILNPTSEAADKINPKDSNWRTESIDLNAYAGCSTAIITFRYISGYGGSINIDNVNFAASTLGVSTVNTPHYTVYPNPASNLVKISAGTDKLEKACLIDVSGKTVLERHNEHNSNELQIDISTIADGLYMLQMISAESVSSTKLIIRR